MLPTDALLHASPLNRLITSEQSVAFDELCARYVDFVYAAALRQCFGDASMAADVTQATFLIFARRGGSIHANALPAWLHRVTGYVAKNARRSEARRRRHEQNAAAQRPEVILPSDRSDDFNPLLDRAIASLSERDRTVVIERYLLGRDVTAIAAVSHTTPAATQKRLERAVARLRRFFQRNGIALADGFAAPALRPAPAVVKQRVATLPVASPLVTQYAGAVMRQMIWVKFTIAGSVLAISAMIAVAATTLATKPITTPTVDVVKATLDHGVTVSIAGIVAPSDPGRIWQANGSDGV